MRRTEKLAKKRTYEKREAATRAYETRKDDDLRENSYQSFNCNTESVFFINFLIGSF